MTTKAPSPPAPTDPVALLSTPLHQSGLTAANLLRRAGIKLGWYDVRDLLCHLPRRYDDLRELATIAQLRDRDDGDVVSSQATVRDLCVEAGFRRRTQRTIARLDDGTGEVSATTAIARKFATPQRRSPRLSAAPTTASRKYTE